MPRYDCPFPTILFSLCWKRFNTTGAVVGILVGLVSCLLLVAVGPNVLGAEGLIKGVDPLFPLENPGIVSIPIGFVAAWLGTLLARERTSEVLTAARLQDGTARKARSRDLRCFPRRSTVLPSISGGSQQHAWTAAC